MASPSINWGFNTKEIMDATHSLFVAPSIGSAQPVNVGYVADLDGVGVDHNSSTGGTYGGRVTFDNAPHDFTDQKYITFDIASKLFGLAFQSDIFANGGMRIYLFDSLNNYSGWNIHGSDVDSNLSGSFDLFDRVGSSAFNSGQRWVIDYNLPPDDASPTPCDLTNVIGCEYHNVRPSGDDFDTYFGRWGTWDKPTVTDGDISDPCDLAFVESQNGNIPDDFDSGRLFRTNDINHSTGLGKLYLCHTGLNIGDGTTPTRWEQDAGQLCFYISRHAAEAQIASGNTRLPEFVYGIAFQPLNVDGFDRYVTINQSPSDYCEFKENFIFSGFKHARGEWSIEITGSTSGTCIFNTNQFINGYEILCNHGEFIECTFNNTERCVINSNTVITNCIFRNLSPTADGIVVDDSPGDFSNITSVFNNTNVGTDLTLGSGGAGIYDFSGLSVSGGHVLKIHNNSLNNIEVKLPSDVPYSATTDGGTVTVSVPANYPLISINGSNGNWIRIYDNNDNVVLSQNNFTGDTSYQIPATGTSNGDWAVVIDKPGFIPKIEKFTVPTIDKIINAELVPLLRGGGDNMYTNIGSPAVSINYDFITPQLSIDIGNQSVDAQEIFNDVENSLITNNGMRWLSEQGSFVRFDNLPGVGNILFLGDNIRVRRANPTDVNSGVSGYIQSTQGTPVDGSNGSVSFVGGIQTAGYQNGKIWIDTIDGVPGITPFVNGVADKPVDTITDALTLANITGLKSLNISVNSSITFSQAMINFIIDCPQASLDGGGQDFCSSRFNGGSHTGEYIHTSGLPTIWNSSSLNNVTFSNHILIDCAIGNFITLNEICDGIWRNCFPFGTIIPTLDFGNHGGSRIEIFEFTGNMNVVNMTSGDTLYIRGSSGADMVIEGNGGYVEVYGSVHSIDFTNFDGVIDDDTLESSIRNLRENQIVINENSKKASKLIPSNNNII